MKNELFEIYKNDKTMMNVVSDYPDKYINSLYAKHAKVKDMILFMEDKGLSYQNGDIYVYHGRGGVKVSPTPKGVRKEISRIATKAGIKMSINDGVIYHGDKVSAKTDGTVDVVEIERDTDSLLGGGKIRSPYAIITIFNDDNSIRSRNFLNIPEDEYLVILRAGSGSKYPTMMASKSIMKRVLAKLYTLLGSSMTEEEKEFVSMMEDEMRSDSEEISQREVSNHDIVQEEEI